MKNIIIHICVCVLVLLTVSGCATFQAGSDVQSGRRALLGGDDATALRYFRRAVQIDPGYVYDGTALQENIWSYIGRSEYATGRLGEARRSLEKALSRKGDDYALELTGEQNMARLYLGLTLARSGNRQQGVRQIERGMMGIHDDIDYVARVFRFSFGQYWDPRREIRSSIEHDLAMLSGKDFSVQRLIADGEWLGKRVEEEINLARHDEQQNLLRD